MALLLWLSVPLPMAATAVAAVVAVVAAPRGGDALISISAEEEDAEKEEEEERVEEDEEEDDGSAPVAAPAPAPAGCRKEGWEESLPAFMGGVASASDVVPFLLRVERAICCRCRSWWDWSEGWKEEGEEVGEEEGMTLEEPDCCGYSVLDAGGGGLIICRRCCSC